MISYNKEEINANRLEALEEKLLTYASFEWDKANKDSDYDEEEEDKLVSKYLEDNRERITAEFLREVQSGTYHCHEALENSSNVLSVSNDLLNQSSILANPVWYAMAHEATTILFNLYQGISGEHVDAIPDNMLDLIEAHKRKRSGKYE